MIGLVFVTDCAGMFRNSRIFDCSLCLTRSCPSYCLIVFILLRKNKNWRLAKMILHLLSLTVEHQVLVKENVLAHKFPCFCLLASISPYRYNILRSHSFVQGLHMALS